MIKGDAPTVAIGGIGGSGTRVGAMLLQKLGYYVGDDLNESLDNLWFTLLFKRRSILLEDEVQFLSLFSLFTQRMEGQTTFLDEQRVQITRLAQDGRAQHSADWLMRRAETFLSDISSRKERQPWGWKEPNTHIVIERLLQFVPKLLYIHFVRHPIDMALSPNQNQLENWGPIMLNHEVEIEPRQSLAYWCASHRRTLSIFQHWPNRTITVDFDALCANPDQQCAQLATFLETELTDDVSKDLRDLVQRGRPAHHRYLNADLRVFDPQDLSYIRELGYCLC